MEIRDAGVEQCYQEFWKEIVEKPDGTLDIEQIKKELFDFRVVMREVSKVYDNVTFGKFSKPNTAAEHIVDAVNDRMTEYTAAAEEEGKEMGIETGKESVLALPSGLPDLTLGQLWQAAKDGRVKIQPEQKPHVADYPLIKTKRTNAVDDYHEELTGERW